MPPSGICRMRISSWSTATRSSSRTGARSGTSARPTRSSGSRRRTWVATPGSTTTSTGPPLRGPASGRWMCPTSRASPTTPTSGSPRPPITPCSRRRPACASPCRVRRPVKTGRTTTMSWRVSGSLPPTAPPRGGAEPAIRSSGSRRGPAAKGWTSPSPTTGSASPTSRRP